MRTPANNKINAMPNNCGLSVRPGLAANFCDRASDCMNLSPDIDDVMPLRILCFSPSSFNCKFSDRMEANSSLNRLFSSFIFLMSSDDSIDNSSAILALLVVLCELVNAEALVATELDRTGVSLVAGITSNTHFNFESIIASGLTSFQSSS